MARRSRRNHEEEGSNDRWLITYSDLITLLLIFFVVMYAMSQISQVKFYALQASLANALHQSPNHGQGDGKTSILTAANPSDVGHKLKSGSATKPAPQDQAFNDLYQKIKAYIQQHNLQAKVSLVDQPRGIQITFRDVVLFDTGQAVVKPQAKVILAGLLPFMKSVQNPIVIEGYTDNRPIHTPQFPSNWELSTARAIHVVEFYAGAGINPTRLSGVGYGQYHPLVPNTTQANRQKNRRVNIVILRDSSSSTGGSSQQQIQNAPAVTSGG